MVLWWGVSSVGERKNASVFATHGLTSLEYPVSQRITTEISCFNDDEQLVGLVYILTFNVFFLKLLTIILYLSNIFKSFQSKNGVQPESVIHTEYDAGDLL